jgi:hypothetical protein
MSDNKKIKTDEAYGAQIGDVFYTVPEFQNLPADEYPRSYSSSMTRTLSRLGHGDINQGEKRLRNNGLENKAERWSEQFGGSPLGPDKK